MPKAKEQNELEKDKKTTKNNTTSKTTKKTTSTQSKEVVKEEEKKNNTDDLLKIIANLQAQIETLTLQVTERQTEKEGEEKQEFLEEDKTDKLIEILANRKQDKEVVIVHNREVIGGASTAIRLTGLSIDFKRMGEERVLTWQQFEECVSKYRRFFDKQIILLSSEYQEISERYSIPCVKRNNNRILTRQELMNVDKLDVHELEKLFLSLTSQDQGFLCSYWLGKCYEGKAEFYDRYKIELLNRLSNSHTFDNLLATMNNDFRKN